MRLSARLGMTLDECLRGTTHRQYLAWLRHAEEELNEPDRHDAYLIQIAAEVRSIMRGLGGRGGSIRFADLIIKFKRPRKKTEEEKAAEAEAVKARWFGALGLDGSGNWRPSQNSKP